MEGERREGGGGGGVRCEVSNEGRRNHLMFLQRSLRVWANFSRQYLDYVLADFGVRCEM